MVFIWRPLEGAKQAGLGFSGHWISVMNAWHQEIEERAEQEGKGGLDEWVRM
jgi:hypothetical protein